MLRDRHPKDKLFDEILQMIQQTVQQAQEMVEQLKP